MKNKPKNWLGIIAAVTAAAGCSGAIGLGTATILTTQMVRDENVTTASLENITKKEGSIMYPVNETGVCTMPEYLPKRATGESVEVVIFKGPPKCGKAGGSEDPYCQKLYLCINGQVKDIGFKNSINSSAHISTGFTPGDYKDCQCLYGDASKYGKTSSCCVTPAGNFTIANKQKKHLDYSKEGWFLLKGKDIGGTEIYKELIALHDMHAKVSSLGYRRSHGCIRMVRSDMKKLYEYINKGDSITIRPDGVDNRKD